MVSGPGGKLAHRGYPAEQLFQIFELCSKIAVKLSENTRSQQFAGSIVVTLAKFASKSQGGFAVTGARCTRHLQQLVRHARHRADDDHWPLWHASEDDLRYSRDGFGVTDRGSAEFHHNTAFDH